MAERLQPGLFSKLIVAEPILYTRPMSEAESAGYSNVLAEGAAKRRASFLSREAVYESFKKRPLFATWSDETLRLYIVRSPLLLVIYIVPLLHFICYFKCVFIVH